MHQLTLTTSPTEPISRINSSIKVYLLQPQIVSQYTCYTRDCDCERKLNRRA